MFLILCNHSKTCFHGFIIALLHKAQNGKKVLKYIKTFPATNELGNIMALKCFNDVYSSLCEKAVKINYII